MAKIMGTVNMDTRFIPPVIVCENVVDLSAIYTLLPARKVAVKAATEPSVPAKDAMMVDFETADGLVAGNVRIKQRCCCRKAMRDESTTS